MATVTQDRAGYGRLLVGIGLTVSLFAVLVFTLDISATARVLSAADLTHIALAGAVSLFAQLCWSLATVTILHGVERGLPRRRIQLGYLAGTFGKQVLPLGNVGGAAILAYVIAEDMDRRFRDVFAAVTASKLPYPTSLGGYGPARSLRVGLSRGLPFYASDEAGGLYSPLTLSVPRFKRTSTGAPPSSAFCRRRRYCKPMFFAAL